MLRFFENDNAKNNDRQFDILLNPGQDPALDLPQTPQTVPKSGGRVWSSCDLDGGGVAAAANARPCWSETFICTERAAS